MAEFNISQRKHPIYDNREKQWRFFMRSYLGGKEYTGSKENLFKHEFEDKPLYDARLKRAYFLNYCKPVVSVYNNYLFAQEIDRKINNKQVKAWAEKVTPEGLTFAELSKSMNLLKLIYGTIYLVIDMPKPSNEELLAEIEGRASRVFDRDKMPIAKIYHPIDVVDWSESGGQYNWALLRETFREDSDPMAEAQASDIYKLWTKTSWATFDEEGKMIDEGENRIGVVPVIRRMNTDIDFNYSGESLIEDIAIINRSIYNWSSLLDEFLYRQALNQLALQGSPEDYQTQNISTAGGFVYPMGAERPAFIAPEVDPAEIIQKQISNAVQEIYRMANLKLMGKSEDAQNYRSVLENAIDFNDTNAALKNQAHESAQFEKEVIALAGKWLGIEEKAEITYPASYDVTSLQADIENALKLLELQMGEKFNARMKERIARKKYPGIQENEIREMIKQFETIEPTQTSSASPEPQA